MKRALSLLMVVAVVATLLPLAAQAGIKYVDVSKTAGGKTGADWDNAYTNLDPAIAAAGSGDSIYVAQGSYYAPVGGFAMKTGVALYGGFVTGGEALADRNWLDHVTTLSGDVNRDDTPGDFATGRTDNRAAVVLSSSAHGVTVDGFKIRGAYAGPGVSITSSSIAVSNCWITDNSGALTGAGVYFNNAATTGLFVNCLISTNYSTSYGGGICAAVVAARITLVGCTVYGNVSTSSRGGGTYFPGGIIFRMTNSIVWGNLMGGNRCNIFLRGDNPTSSDYCYYTCDASGSTSSYTNGAVGVGAHDVRDGTSPMLIADTAGGNGNLHLSAWSPCKTAGLAGMSPPKDYDLVTRGSPPAVGALEYVAYDVDTTPPAEVTGAGVTAGHKFLTLSWINPGDADFSGVVVLRTSSNAPVGVPNPPTTAPQEGATYALNATIGNAKVAYVGNGTSFTNTSLLIGSNYFYKIWTYDTLKNYSDAPVQVDSVPVADIVAPYPVTGASATPLSDTSVQLDWVNSSSSDSLGVIILRRIGAASTDVPVNTNIYVVGNTIGNSTVVYTNTGTATTWTDTGLLFGDTAHHYSIFAFDVAPNYAPRTDVSAVTDVDPTAPAEVTGVTATGDDAENVLGWTNPADTDIQGVIILRSTTATPNGTPVAGTTYTVGQALGDGTVVFVGGSTAPSGASAWTDSALANGTPYYYKIFARDEYNYAASGVAASATPAAPAVVKYVNGAASGDNNGTTWTHAYTTLTNALSSTSAGELWVAAGTYKPAGVGGATSNHFTMKTNVKLYGGFSGTETNRYQRNWTDHVTILSGDLSADNNDSRDGSNGTNWINRSDNVSNVIWLVTVTNVVVDGFTVKGGYSTGATGLGAGMYGNNATGTVANCVFVDNRAGYAGGGLYFTGVKANIENCLIVSNATIQSGGGMYAKTYAAGPGEIRNCVFRDNRCEGSSDSKSDGGGFYLSACPYTINSCTVYGNVAGRRGGGMKLEGGGTPTYTVKNCILWNNRTVIVNTGENDGGYQLCTQVTLTLNMSNCDWEPATVGKGYSDQHYNYQGTCTFTSMKELDPAFVGGASGNFRLTADSPCVDAGTGSGAPARDMDLTLRPQGAGFDMGAYEYVAVAGGDTTPPAEVSAVSVTPGHQFLAPSWTNPGDADFAGVLVVRKLGSAPTFTPGSGASYTIGQTVGDITVVYTNSGTGFTDSGLVNGTTYHYKFFTYDALMNYSAGVGASSAPEADATPPEPVTSLTVAAQSDSSIQLGWVNSSSPDAVGVIILRKTGGVPTGTPTALTTYTVGTVINDGTVVYVGTGSTWTDTTLTQELTTYGYSVFARDIAPNYSTRADGSDATLTDNTAPGNVTAQTATPDDGAVALAWTYPADADVAGVLVLRRTAGTPSGTPTAGTTYTVGQAIDDGTVVYVSSGAAPGSAGAWSEEGLVNGTHYYYKIFARDEHPNYASGGAAADAIPAGPVNVKYVNGAVGSEGDGSSWDTAFKTLTNALASTTVGEIWVAQGVYTPGAATTNFTIKSNVKVYGGFTSGTAHRYQRDWIANDTVLNGDIGGNDEAEWAGRSENCTYVVRLGGQTGAVLDGFRITGGGDLLANAGSGLLLDGGSMSFANCNIISNSGLYGGAMYMSVSSKVDFVNCLIVTNRASYGGALYYYGNNPGLDLSFVNCTITRNFGLTRGGGLYFQAIDVGMGVIKLRNTILWANYNGTQHQDMHTQGVYWNIVDSDYSCYNFYNGGNYHVAGAHDREDVDPVLLKMENGDVRLLCGSPCIDTGTFTGAPAKDINGVARPVGSGIDMGAYEGAMYTVTVNPSAGATVTFNGQAYGSSTVVPVEADTYTATYTAPPAEGTTTQYVFSAWTLEGAGAGSAASLSVPVNDSTGNRTVGTTFTKQFKLALTVVGGAYGSVVGGSDGAWYNNGALLELDAQPLPRATFVGWTGCVGGLVTMDSAKSVTATFDSTDPTFIMFQ
jgi:hypothetical protein